MLWMNIKNFLVESNLIFKKGVFEYQETVAGTYDVFVASGRSRGGVTDNISTRQVESCLNKRGCGCVVWRRMVEFKENVS